MKNILTFISIAIFNNLFAQKIDFSDKLFCTASLESIEIPVDKLELISQNETIELTKIERQLFAFPDNLEEFEFDSIQILLVDQKLTFSAQNIRIHNLLGRTMTLDFRKTLDYDCIQVTHTLGDVIQIFEPDTTCAHRLDIKTNFGECLLKFRGEIISDCDLKSELRNEIQNGKPAKYE